MKKILESAAILALLTLPFAGPLAAQAELDTVDVLSNGSFSYSQNDKFGFSDAKGKAILPARFEELSIQEKEQIIVATLNGKAGTYDLNGKPVIPHAFEEISDFHHGYALAMKGERWGAINKTGKILIAIENDLAEAVEPARRLVVTKKNFVWRLHDMQTGAALPYSFDVYPKLGAGRIVFRQEKLFGYLNEEGNVAIPAQFAKAELFDEGIRQAVVEKNGKSLRIDTVGQCVDGCE